MLKTVDQSLKLLNYFSKEKPSWGARELAKETGMNHSTVYRILETLEANRFLVKDDATKKYTLGIRLWELGLRMYDSMKLPELIRPIMKQLMIDTGESVFLTGLDGDEALTLDAMEPDNKVKYSVSLGSRVPLYAGASYRAILAFMPPEKIDNILRGTLQAYTENTMTDPQQIRETLTEIREKGWAQSSGEYTRDVMAIAVPLFDANDHIVGSLTVSGPKYRFTENDITRHLPLLQQAKEDVSAVMKKYRLNLNRYFNN
jgi:DNA-binding IclR family transcriptional regulator